MNRHVPQGQSGDERRVIGVVLTVVAVLAIVFYTQPTPLIATLSSPSGTHRVDLVGRADVPTFPLLTHRVSATVATRGVVTIKEWPIHSAHRLDSSFLETYRAPRWLTDSVLLLPRSAATVSAEPDVLELTNSSANSLALLTIDADDLTLVIDLAPGARIAFPFRLRGGDVTEYRVEGRWLNGARVPTSRGVLRAPATSDASRAYVLNVGDAGGTIEPAARPTP